MVQRYGTVTVVRYSVVQWYTVRCYGTVHVVQQHNTVVQWYNNVVQHSGTISLQVDYGTVISMMFFSCE